MATTTLVCKQCNFENEPERVYCHNCGAKLDRSLLPPEATKREDPVVVQERVRKMISPRRGAGLRWLRNLVISLVTASLLAMLAVIAEPPGNVPEVSRDAVLSAPTITDDLDELVTQPIARRLTYTDDQVNAFLQSAIKSKKDNATGYVVLKFEHVFAHFDEGTVTILQQRSVLGYSLYTSTTQAVEIKNGVLDSHPVGAKFGRLPIPPRILPYIGIVFDSLWKVMERDRALIARMQSITFHKNTVEIINKPASAH